MCDLKIKTRSTGRRGHRGQWAKEAEAIDALGSRFYVLGNSKLGSNWIVRVKDVETGEVLTAQSLDLHDNLAAQKELVRSLHEKARAS